jgi:hypothetical protein
MDSFRFLILMFLGLFLSALSLFVFLVGVPLLVNRSLTVVEGVCGMLLYTTFSLALAYAAWRAFAAAHKKLAAQ